MIGSLAQSLLKQQVGVFLTVKKCDIVFNGKLARCCSIGGKYARRLAQVAQHRLDPELFDMPFERIASGFGSIIYF